MQAPALSWINISHQVKMTHLKGRGGSRPGGGRKEAEVTDGVTCWST